MGKLYRGLIIDAVGSIKRQDKPVVLASVLEERAQRWRDIAATVAPHLKDGMEVMVAETLVELQAMHIIPSNALPGSTTALDYAAGIEAAKTADKVRMPLANPLSFELHLIQKLGSVAHGLEYRDELSRLVKHASSVLAEYAESAKVTATQLMTQAHEPAVMVENKIVKGLRTFAEEVGKTSHEVGDWAHKIANVAGDMGANPILGKNLRDFFGGVSGVAGSVTHITEDINKGVGVVLSLIRQISKPAEDDIKRTNTSVKAGVAVATGIVDKVNHTLGQVDQGLDAVGLLVGLIPGGNKLATEIVTVGKAGVSIVSNLLSVFAGSAAAGPLAPIVAITGAISTLVGAIFGSGPDVTQVIKDEINKLSQHVDERFDRVEALILTTTKALMQHMDEAFASLEHDMSEQFKHLEIVMGNYHRKLLEQFVQIHKEAAAIQRSVDLLSERTAHLEERLARDLGNIYTADYKKECALAFGTPPQLFTDIEQQRLYIFFKHCVTEVAYNPILSGDPLINYRAAEIVEHVTNEGLDSHINDLKRYLGNLGVVSPGGVFFNPAAWNEMITTVLAFCGRQPHLDPRVAGYVKNDTDNFISEGVTFNKWILDIRANGNLFNQLLKEYRSALEAVARTAVRVAFYDVITDASAEDADLDTGLARARFLNLFRTFGKEAELTRGVAFTDAGVPSFVDPGDFPLVKLAHEFTRWVVEITTWESINKGGPVKRGAWKDDASADAWADASCMPDGKFVHGLHDRAGVQAIVRDYYNAARDHGRTVAAQGVQWRDDYGALKGRIDAYKDGRDRLLQVCGGLLRREINKVDGAADVRVVEESLSALSDTERVDHFKRLTLIDAGTNVHLAEALSAMKASLANLDLAYGQLSIVIALAFPHLYASDARLNICLQALWDSANFQAYTALAAICEDDAVRLGTPDAKAQERSFVNLYMQEKVFPALADLDLYLQELVKEAQVCKDSGLPFVGHPLVDDAITKLQVFRAAFADKAVEALAEAGAGAEAGAEIVSPFADVLAPVEAPPATEDTEVRP